MSSEVYQCWQFRSQVGGGVAVVTLGNEDKFATNDGASILVATHCSPLSYAAAPHAFTDRPQSSVP
jgi:hypothetical protein